MAGVAMDVTQRKLLEDKRQSQKLETWGAAGVRMTSISVGV